MYASVQKDIQGYTGLYKGKHNIYATHTSDERDIPRSHHGHLYHAIENTVARLEGRV